jgi:hypothetical protein
MGWPGIHKLARDQGGLVAAILSLALIPVCHWSLSKALVGGAAALPTPTGASHW